MSVFRCPDCDGKISTKKDWDEEFEWYECPSCEGCFTHRDLVIQSKADKAAESASEGRTGHASKKTAGSKAPLAKGKKRRTEIQEDEEALRELEAKMLKPKVKQEEPVRHRNEVPTGQVVNILADEITALYEEDGTKIDQVNARDKALILWRELHFTHRVPARDTSVKIRFCGEHA